MYFPFGANKRRGEAGMSHMKGKRCQSSAIGCSHKLTLTIPDSISISSNVSLVVVKHLISILERIHYISDTIAACYQDKENEMSGVFVSVAAQQLSCFISFISISTSRSI